MNKYLLNAAVLLLAFSGVISLAQYSNQNVNCDELIRDTYNNNARTNTNYVVTTENAQRCLADAGFYSYADQNGKQLFTGKYGTVTESAAEAYLNRDNKKTQEAAENAKKAEAAKIEALRIAEQEKINQQKKSEETKIEPQASPSSSSSTPNTQIAAFPKNDTITDSREPATADKFLINSIYFLFALPFILFAISIIAAFLKVFKNPNQK